jgi:hypothetical protein
MGVHSQHLGKQMQKEYEFEASLDYMVRPYLNKSKRLGVQHMQSSGFHPQYKKFIQRKKRAGGVSGKVSA